MTVDPNTGLIQWTPDIGGVTESVEVQVSDGQGGTDTQSFSITVAEVNDAPVITSTPPTQVVAAQAYTYDVEATDEENNPLTFSLNTALAEMTTVSWARWTRR